MLKNHFIQKSNLIQKSYILKNLYLFKKLILFKSLIFFKYIILFKNPLFLLWDSITFFHDKFWQKKIGVKAFFATVI